METSLALSVSMDVSQALVDVPVADDLHNGKNISHKCLNVPTLILNKFANWDRLC